jgi:hypothetical protein
VYIFPDGLHLLLEQVNVGSYWQLGGSFEVLIIRPKVLDGLNDCNRLQALLEGIFSLDEVLIPKLEPR